MPTIFSVIRRSAYCIRFLWRGFADASDRLFPSGESHHSHSTLAKAVGSDLKGKVSLIIYVAGILLAFVAPWISIALYVLVPAMWIVPDKRIEKMMEHDSEPHAPA